MTKTNSVANLITEKTVEIYWTEGSAPYTAHVELANAETHVKANDEYASEAALLLAVRADEATPGYRKIGEGEDSTGDWCDVYEAVPTKTTLTLEMRDDCQGNESIEIDDASEVREACEDWARGGEWGDDGAAIDVSWTLYGTDGDEIDEGSVLVNIEPNHDRLIKAAGGDINCDHEWTAEGEGGCTENPGVWSNGGTAMTFSTHCKCCGLKRVEHSTGSQRNPGEHDTVSYEMPTDEEIEAYREDGAMND